MCTVSIDKITGFFFLSIAVSFDDLWMRKLNADIIYDLIVHNIISTLIELGDQLYSVGC